MITRLSEISDYAISDYATHNLGDVPSFVLEHSQGFTVTTEGVQSLRVLKGRRVVGSGVNGYIVNDYFFRLSLKVVIDCIYNL